MPRKITSHTLESLMARTIEVGECMEWTGYMANRTPQVCHADKLWSVRRLVRHLQGRPVKPRAFLSTSCGNPKCVNPDHIIERSHKQHMTHMAKAVDHNSPTRVTKLQDRAKHRRKLTDEQVGICLLDPRSCATLAREFGVSKSLISRYRNGGAGRQFNASVNPFAGLLK